MSTPPQDRHDNGQGAGPDPLPPAKTPLRPGTITVVGVVLALLLTGLGAIGLQAAASAAGLSTAKPWLTEAVTGADGLTPLAWMPPLAVLIIAVGLWLLYVALRPRPKTAIAVDAATGVFIGPRDLARIVDHAARDVDGVTDTRSYATRAKVTVRVQATGAAGVKDAVSLAVAPTLNALKKTPRVSVTVKEARP